MERTFVSWLRASGGVHAFLLTNLALFTVASPLPAFAKPRPPLPPWPEQSLVGWQFDNPKSDGTGPRAPLRMDNVPWVESWSGYAVQMSGKKPAALALPLVDTTAQALFSPGTGSIRFWFRPDWSSASLGGKGPENYARLLELGAWTANASLGWIGLYADPAGDGLFLGSQAQGRHLDHVATPIQWKAGEWHQVAVNYSPQATALIVDGVLVAEGDGIAEWPAVELLAQFGLGVGGDRAGGSLAQGWFDEITTFATPCGMLETTFNYLAVAPVAALGPITPEEVQARLAARQMGLSAAAAGGELSLEGLSAPAWEGGCTNGLALIPTLLTNGHYLLTVCSADPNETYTLFFTTNLVPSVTWTAIATNGPGLSEFEFTNLPQPQGFFILGTALDMDGDGLSDAYEQLVTHTDPYEGLGEFKVLITQPKPFSTLP